MKATPPIGVTGPINLALLPNAWAKAIMYKEPENKMMPSAKNLPAATGLLSLLMSPRMRVMNMAITWIMW